MRYLPVLLLLAFSFTGFSQSTYEVNTLIFKAKEEFRVYFLRSKTDFYKLESQFHKIGVTSITQEYPRSSKPRESVNQLGMPTTDISLIYRLKYSGDFKPTDLVNNLMRTGAFQYVEPSFIFQSLYTPNDSELNTWNHLEFMNVLDAWDVTKGDTNVVIGISDAGYYMNNMELFPKVVSSNLNFSMTNAAHGTAVATTAAGSTNNAFGKSSIGFNSSLDLRPMNYNGLLEATYAGAKVINASWAGGCYYSFYGQDIVNEVYNNGSIIVASAGNGSTCNNAATKVYPASYEHVISVTSVGPSNIVKFLDKSTVIIL